MLVGDIPGVQVEQSMCTTCPLHYYRKPCKILFLYSLGPLQHVMLTAKMGIEKIISIYIEKGVDLSGADKKRKSVNQFGPDEVIYYKYWHRTLILLFDCT